ncbi:circumsporozoite protein-like [Ochlerotatus camptorhynchus]|uniref:circumsporozoite protein-like n=1 Tax=Ochlerotatus camptorhynchus TaxID=644619 RepID=UPI0031CF03C0
MSGQRQMIGSISEYNNELDDWNVYYERLEQFFEVNDVPDEKRSAFLISVIGADAYKSLRDLCHPILPRDKPFEALCELLRKQFSPQISIFRERVKFYNARQEGYENVTQWYGRLKRLSVDCKFCGNLEGVLLDKFITGLRPGQVLDRLCEENQALKLEQALDIAVNKECAAKENAYLPYRPPRCGVDQPPKFQKCLFGGGPVQSPRLAICPPAPTGYRPQARGFDGVGSLFGGSGGGAAAEFEFGAAPAAQPTTALFGSLSAGQPEQEEVADSAPALGAGLFSAVNQEQQPQEQQDGIPEGANRVGGPAAKGRRVRTRRRGAGRRGAAGDTGDQNSVDGEQQ